MHVLGGGAGTRSHTTSVPKVHDTWSEHGQGKPTGPGWENSQHGRHARRTTSRVFNLGSENATGVRVVVEREVRYDHDAVSESEKSVSDGKK